MAGAWTQALERYAGPCRIAQLAREREVVRVLDIGTGVGLNLAAALASAEGGRARLDVTSLEADPGVFAAAFALGPWPPSCAVWIAHAQRALATALAANGVAELAPVRGSLRLRLGDARRTVLECGAERFDAVFLDPFAPREAPQLWSPEFLRVLAGLMERDAILSTYSAALDVRVALAATGLRVGRGPRVGRKAEGTLASFESELPPLDRRVERRVLRRSNAAGPWRSEGLSGAI